MTDIVRAGLAAAFLALAAPAGAAPVDFILDDGTSDIALGNFSGEEPVDLLVVNQFDAGPSGATITEISYVFGTPGASVPTVAVPLQVVLFEDPDDNGSFDNAVLLLAADDTPTQVDNDTFNIVAITPTFVIGQFFVGLFAPGIDDGQAIVGADTNESGATFSFAGSALDLDNVLGTADVFAFDPDFVGIALIRAAGVTVDEPAGLGLLALAALALLSRRARPRCRRG